MFNSLDARRTLGRPDPKRLLARIGMGFITPPTILNINGNNDVDQRNGGASASFTNLSPWVTDRWQCASSTVTTQTLSAQKTASTIPGFANSLTVTIGGTGAVLGAGSYAFIHTYLEGLDVGSLKWGTASAAPVTIAFWIKPSVSGRLCLAVRNQVPNRSYVAPFDVVANSARRIVLKIPGDKSGTWATDNSGALDISISLGVGSALSTTPGTWQSGNLVGLTNGSNLLANNSATVEITGLTITPGEIPAVPIIKPYGEIITPCLRYFQYAQAFTAMVTGSLSTAIADVPFVSPMRISPAVSQKTILAFWAAGNFDYAQTSPSIAVFNSKITDRGAQLIIGNLPTVANQGDIILCSPGTQILLDAETP